jgi:hypothetical protein
VRKGKILALTLIMGALGVAHSNFIAPASAASPKYTACLKEAEAKGLLTTHTQGRAAGARANAGLASQRNAFMTECMARR